MLALILVIVRSMAADVLLAAEINLSRTSILWQAGTAECRFGDAIVTGALRDGYAVEGLTPALIMFPRRKRWRALLLVTPLRDWQHNPLFLGTKVRQHPDKQADFFLLIVDLFAQKCTPDDGFVDGLEPLFRTLRRAERRWMAFFIASLHVRRAIVSDDEQTALRLQAPPCWRRRHCEAFIQTISDSGRHK